MLKRVSVIAILIAAPALAQQAPPPDPVAATYAQLLSEANSRVAALSGQLQQANAKIADLQKQIDAAKPKDAKPMSDAIGVKPPGGGVVDAPK
jgi:hypothetical protein